MGNTAGNTDSPRTIKQFKIRCSAIGQIMGVKGLGKTGQSYCETWLKEQMYGRKKEFSNRYTQKGLIVEDNSIDFVGEMLGLGFIMKNEENFENDFMTGTPDVILKDMIIDLKNSWDVFTFPYFDKELPNSDYYWQAQGYMALTGRSNYKVIYVLSDTPEHLIESEMRRYGFQNGIEQDDLDYKEWYDKMTYSDIPNEMKIKVFDIQRNYEDIKKIESRVLECRAYIESICSVNVEIPEKKPEPEKEIVITPKQSKLQKPNQGTNYFYIVFNAINGFFVWNTTWHNSDLDNSLYNAGNCFLEPKEPEDIVSDLNKRLSERTNK